MPTVKELSADLGKERDGLKAFFSEHTEDGALKMSAEDVAKARTWNETIGTKAKALDDAVSLENIQSENEDGIKALKRPNGRVITDSDDTDPSASVKTFRSLGELFTTSDAFKSSQKLAQGAVGPTYEVDLEKVYGKSAARHGIKTLFDTSGFAIQNLRLPTPITPAEQGLTVASLFPEGQTSQAAIAYMEETTTTKGAAETAESGSKPEAALAFTERTSTVRKIAVSLPVTDESLEDIPFIESYIDTRLSLFVRQREDAQLLTGDGSAPNLRGILNISGIQTQAKGADPTPDAIFKGMQKVRSVGFLEPTGVVLHPNDWTDIRLLRTADGIYIWGNPSEAGPERIFGATVVQTTALTENTGLVGAFRTAAEIFRRSELAMQVGWVNDQFVKNQRTILVEERLALVVFRPKGFCTVTGI